MSAGMKNYPVKWEGAVKAGKQMANAIVEYIGGIEVVKALVNPPVPTKNILTQ